MIERSANGSFVLHAAEIRDWPAMQYRGLSDDLSRGPVDTLEFQKKIVRTLAAYKANLYSPYFENTQQYASNPLPAPPGGSISADDARELVAYAAKYHVMIVPDQEAFGHLRHMLVYEQYQPLAETPHGAVLAPGQAGSLQVINQMFTELAALYPSPFLHIGADETFDLGVGQTKPAVDQQGLGPVYLDFMQQIDNTLRPLNRQLLFWGDIAERSPDLLKGMPEELQAQHDCHQLALLALGHRLYEISELLQVRRLRDLGLARHQQLVARLSRTTTWDWKTSSSSHAMASRWAPPAS